MKLKIMFAALAALACAPPAMAQVLSADQVTGQPGAVQGTASDGKRIELPVYVPVRADGSVIDPAGGGTGASAQQVQGPSGDLATQIGNPIPVGCEFLTTLPTLTNGQGAQMRCTSRNELLVTPSIGGTTIGNTTGIFAVGNVASAAADSGNPVKMGGVYLATPTAVATGQRVNMLTDSFGNQRATLTGGGFTPVDGGTVVIRPYDSASQTTNAPLGTLGYYWTGSAIALARGDSGGGYVIQKLDAAASSGVVPAVTAAVGAGQVVKASAGNLFGLNVVSGASAGYVLVTNTTTVPADGAVTPLKCYALPANSSLDLNLRAAPVYFSTGISVSFSTTGCFTKTASATAFISGDAK